MNEARRHEDRAAAPGRGVDSVDRPGAGHLAWGGGPRAGARASAA